LEGRDATVVDQHTIWFNGKTTGHYSFVGSMLTKDEMRGNR
jgi:hypothetical protein